MNRFETTLQALQSVVQSSYSADWITPTIEAGIRELVRPDVFDVLPPEGRRLVVTYGAPMVKVGLEKRQSGEEIQLNLRAFALGALGMSLVRHPKDRGAVVP